MVQNSLYYFLNEYGQFKVLGKIENGTTTTEGRSATTIGLKNESITSSTTNDSTMHAVIHDDYKEKFLDGLLASEFDETSCISRLQSHLYRKSSPHKPSSYLISKLRNYEEIHTRCGPNGKAYNTIMAKILHSKNIK
ncbi:galactoside 2-alpha-l-fucosyltransferase-like protein, partial [Trifolium pratense]